MSRIEDFRELLSHCQSLQYDLNEKECKKRVKKGKVRKKEQKDRFKKQGVRTDSFLAVLSINET